MQNECCNTCIHINAHYTGNVPVLLDDVRCNGREQDLLSCRHKPVGVHNCIRNYVIAIIYSHTFQVHSMHAWRWYS